MVECSVTCQFVKGDLFSGLARDSHHKMLRIATHIFKLEVRQATIEIDQEILKLGLDVLLEEGLRVLLIVIDRDHILRTHMLENWHIFKR